MSSGTTEKREKALTHLPSDVEMEQLATAISSASVEPIDAYAKFYALYSPLIISQLSLMGKKQIIRLVSTLIKHPLSEDELKVRTTPEKNMFKMLDELFTSKYFMMITSYLENERKIQEAEDNGKKEAQEINNKGEEVNG